MPVISSPTRSRYSSNIMSRSASRMRWRITCLAVCAAMRPKSSGVTSRSSIWSRYCSNFSGSISGSCGSTHLAGLGVDVRALVDRLDDQLGLEALGDDQLDHAVVAGLAVHLDAGVLGRAGLLLVRRQQRVLERGDELRRGRCPSRRPGRCMASRISRDMRLLLDEVGTADVVVRDRDRRRSSTAIVTSASVAPTSSPGERLRGRARGVARADAGAAAQEAAEVRRAWSAGARAAGRGDLERVALADLGAAGA